MSRVQIGLATPLGTETTSFFPTRLWNLLQDLIFGPASLEKSALCASILWKMGVILSAAHVKKNAKPIVAARGSYQESY